MQHFAAIEKQAGPADVPPVSAADVDEWRRRSYLSYEAFLRARLRDLDDQRTSLWQRDYSSLDAYLRSVRPMRRRLQRMLGWWIDPRERAPLVVGPREQLLQTADGLVAERFMLQVVPGLETYAVELRPPGSESTRGLLLQHGYGGTPEAICGLTNTSNAADYSYRSLGLRAARRGFHVLAVFHPSGYGSLTDEIGSLPDHPERGKNYGKNRLHRLATLAGSTLFGLDIIACSRGVDLLLTRPHIKRLGVYGLSQGGQSALFLAALDERVSAGVCSAYFNMRLSKLIGPQRALCYLDSAEEDKFFTEVVSCFSDADLVSLIAPRAIAIEAGIEDSSVDFEKAAEEFGRAQRHYQMLGLKDRFEFVAHEQGHVSATGRALEFLEEHLFRG